MTDDQVVEVQIGRPPRAPADVVVRCHLGLPVVTKVPPVLEDGTPFPTRWWLTCPLAQRRIGRLEGAGGVKAMDRRIAADQSFAARMSAAHERYAAERQAATPPEAVHRPSGGVAGIERGAKCLHAHYADTAAGNDNPIGELVAAWIEPLDCALPCVVDGDDGGATKNRRWTEPK